MLKLVRYADSFLRRAAGFVFACRNPPLSRRQTRNPLPVSSRPRVIPAAPEPITQMSASMIDLSEMRRASMNIDFDPSSLTELRVSANAAGVLRVRIPDPSNTVTLILHVPRRE